ncbi:HEAT repeat domain-containing protein [Schlesneria paludicola]|uniref:HEAT repeat domain-containing protein n=1 Tax=Schlesneria paludicola TaxID=360056 RepID=UPI00029B1AE9|nr:HEAT repeat domain-containing protein [Schlesneria paludicola]
MSSSTRWVCLLLISVSGIEFWMLGGTVVAAEKSKIQAAIKKGQDFLLKQQLSGAHGTIAGLAYIKSGGDKTAPALQRLAQDILGKIKESTYKPSYQHNYEAGVDLMFLEAFDAEKFRPQLEAISAHLLYTQLPNGAWYYPNPTEPDAGDTSITQYAVMGLWAAARAGVEIPVDAWERCAKWHIAKQRADGGFCYHPFEEHSAASFQHNQSIGTMTAAGASNLLIIRRMLFGDTDLDAELRPPEVKRRFGVLEKFTEEKRIAPKAQVTIRVASIDKVVKESVQWTSLHLGDNGRDRASWLLYYMYSIERVAALMDVDKLGTHDWYEEGADDLLLKQAADGSWTDGCGPTASTALGLMFLSKATTSIIAPKARVKLLGGGLQAGGRGLPENLDAVQVKDGAVVSRKIVGPVDDLLSELERSSDAKVEDIQAAVVDAVQLDHPEELIGQIARLRKLATDSRVEVRRTAYWALGRSGDVSAARVLIQGLMDSDLDAVREASIGLCILSRRPEGVGKPIDPTDDVEMGQKDGATDEERLAVIAAWKSESKKRWTDWYQKNRNYDERDDRNSLKRSTK